MAIPPKKTQIDTTRRHAITALYSLRELSRSDRAAALTHALKIEYLFDRVTDATKLRIADATNATNATNANNSSHHKDSQ